MHAPPCLSSAVPPGRRFGGQISVQIRGAGCYGGRACNCCSDPDHFSNAPFAWQLLAQLYKYNCCGFYLCEVGLA